MFVGDAFISRDEPWWFNLMRRIVAVFFISIVLFNAYFQFNNLTMFINTPNIVTIETKDDTNNVTFPGFILCPEDLRPKFAIKGRKDKQKERETMPPQFSIKCGCSFAMGPEILSENENFVDSQCDTLFTQEEGCFRYNSNTISKGIKNNSKDNNLISQGFNRTFMFFNIIPFENAIKPLFYTIYFDEYQAYSIYNNTNYSVEYNMFPILTDQRTILEYSISAHNYYSSVLMGQLNSRPELYSMEIKAEMKTIPREQVTSGIQFVMIPKLHYMRKEIEKYEWQIYTVISNLGGFYGAIVTVYVACFGMHRIEPWGFLQKYIFICWRCRRSFKNSLASRYVSTSGIPMGEKVGDRPKGSTLEDRFQMLEDALKDFYLDPYYLEILKLTKMHYDEREVQYQTIEEPSEDEKYNNNEGNGGNDKSPDKPEFIMIPIPSPTFPHLYYNLYVC